MQDLTSEYWNERYINASTGWDLGDVSPPIKEYVNQLKDKSIKILIPGCGNAHEAEFLHKNGFTNVHLLDFAEAPLVEFKQRVKDFPQEHLHQDDFFKHEGKYDLIIEQTLFCAIDPSLRDNYVSTVSRLLATKGKLVGLLFNCYFEAGPPFGGELKEYQKQFLAQFKNVIMEPCHNSIGPRLGKELFIRVQKD